MNYPGFVEPAQPRVYYRLEEGPWNISRREDGTIWASIPVYRRPTFLRPTPEYMRSVDAPYIVPVTAGDVFFTFCTSMANVHTSGAPTRLVFRDIHPASYTGITNVQAWMSHHPLLGRPVTVVKFYTNKDLPTAEDYISSICWLNEQGQEICGCPSYAIKLSGAAGREFVIQPQDIVDIVTQVVEVPRVRRRH